MLPLDIMSVSMEKGSDLVVGSKQRRAKTRVPAVDTACVSDWIGGYWLFDDLLCTGHRRSLDGNLTVACRCIGWASGLR